MSFRAEKLWTWHGRQTDVCWTLEHQRIIMPMSSAQHDLPDYRYPGTWLNKWRKVSGSWLRPGSRLHDESQSRLHGELESWLESLVKRFTRGATNMHHGREYHSHVILLHQVATLHCASSVWRPVQPQCSKRVLRARLCLKHCYIVQLRVEANGYLAQATR